MPKPATTVRLIMLGDSITYGLWVPLGKTFSDRLEFILNQEAGRPKLERKYEVMNFGVPGYNLGAEVEIFKTRGLLYKPDIVVLNMFCNDNDPLPGPDYSTFYGVVNNMLYRSKLYLFLKHRLGVLQRKMAPAANRPTHGRYLQDMATIVEGLGELSFLSQKNHFKLLVCLHSDLLFREDRNSLRFYQIAQDFNLPVFNMTEYYRKSGIPAASLSLNGHKEDMCHPNERGHDIIVKAMHEELKKKGYLSGE